MTTGQRTRQSGGPRRGGPGGFQRRRRGRHALKAEEIDYKDVQLMRRFVSERGKLVSGQRIGVTAKNQRRLARAIKRAQHLALIPMAPNHVYVTGGIQPETQSQDTSEESENAEAVAPTAAAAETPAAETETATETPATSDEATESADAPAEAPSEESDDES